MHLVILFLAGINFMHRIGHLYQPSTVASKTIIKLLLSLMSSASGNRIDLDHQTPTVQTAFEPNLL